MESFSDRRLEGLNKGITTEQQAQAVKILDELGILLYANFIVDPAFSREDFRELVRYVRMLNLKYASFSVLTPLPGTALYNERESELLTKRHEMFDFMHTVLPTTLPLKEFYAELAWLFGNALPVRHTFGILRKYGVMRALKLLIKYPYYPCKTQKGIYGLWQGYVSFGHRPGSEFFLKKVLTNSGNVLFYNYGTIELCKNI